MNSVTTCSPRPNHPCRHVLRQASSSSSSPSSAPSTASDDEHHGNTSDFSDDDVTLNEMLGKYDESYVYEKETDILSDSDPTDCEDQPDYGKKFTQYHMYVHFIFAQNCPAYFYIACWLICVHVLISLALESNSTNCNIILSLISENHELPNSECETKTIFLCLFIYWLRFIYLLITISCYKMIVKI